MQKNVFSERHHFYWGTFSGIVFFVLLSISFLYAKEPLSPQQLLMTKSVTSAKISPNGEWVAFVKSVPRDAKDKPGSSYAELWLHHIKTNKTKAFVTGKEKVSHVQWHPDGSAITFLTNRDEDHYTQVYAIPLNGGEATCLTDADYTISNYAWAPDGKIIYYLSLQPQSLRQRVLDRNGYDFVFFEEDWRHRNLYKWDIEKRESTQMTEGRTVWSFAIAPDGKTAAIATSPKNLVDHKYAFQTISILDFATKSITPLVKNSRKFGDYSVSPDGKHLVLAAALDKADHDVSQVFVYEIATGKEHNLTPENYKGHVTWAGWMDKNTVLYHAAEGSEVKLYKKKRNATASKKVLDSENVNVIFQTPDFDKNMNQFVTLGETPYSPREFYIGQLGKAIERRSFVNPAFENVTFGNQRVIRYKSRDGWEIEGILIEPVGFQSGKTYPLVVLVHGGPESHYSNEWVSSYSRPAQVLAGKGYLVFLPNYRSSTGYGLEYAKIGYNDAAGKEFDDIADGIDYLVEQGLADGDRVGLGGGSYGGFASAWFASFYTEKVRAVCMFVGISNLVSKRGTTDIPYEELFVHSGEKLENMWEQSLRRSPIYYAHQSQTATLIMGGTADTRVHPSQSLEFYRRLKMNDHPAVRYVQYPGEPHGNKKQPGQIDVLYRTLDWYDWYVRDQKPLAGPMPPLDISEKYGVNLPDNK